MSPGTEHHSWDVTASQKGAQVGCSLPPTPGEAQHCVPVCVSAVLRVLQGLAVPKAMVSSATAWQCHPCPLLQFVLLLQEILV